jgi:hypothetical protein
MMAWLLDNADKIFSAVGIALISGLAWISTDRSCPNT